MALTKEPPVRRMFIGDQGAHVLCQDGVMVVHDGDDCAYINLADGDIERLADFFWELKTGESAR